LFDVDGDGATKKKIKIPLSLLAKKNMKIFVATNLRQKI